MMEHETPDLPADVSAARAYVQRVMEATGLDATNVARRAGLDPSTLTRLMKAQPRGGLRRATLEALERHFGIPLPIEMAAPAVAKPAVMAPHTHDVPIHGLVGTHAEGRFFWNQTVLDYACRPAGISHASRVFALRMPDESMDGWRRIDELIFVDPTRTVAEGDHAFVELANSGDPNNHSLYMIRRVVRRRPAGVVLQTWGYEPKEETLPRQAVLAFHKIIEWPELLGC